MSSVVKGLSMSEVRKCLQKIRVEWDRQTPWAPFDPSSTVTAVDPDKRTMSMSEFAWLFVIGHHTNRKRQKRSGELSVKIK